jgi:phosphoglycolate phosphatase
MLKNVFFDLDGTLTDPKQGITRCIQHALRSLDKPYFSENELQQFIGPPLRSSFKKLLHSDEESLIEEAVRLYRERFSTIGIFENTIYPGIVDLLAALRDESIRLYVVTAKPKIYADRIVEHFELTGYFYHVYGSELDGSYDNKGKLIEHIMGQLKLVPADTAMIGDRRDDITAGKMNRLRTVGVTYGYGSKEEINESDPDHICHTPNEIQNIVLSLA